MQTEGFKSIRFSTDDLPERERIPVWREFFGPSVFRTEIEPAADVPFHADVTVRRLPGISLVSNVMSPARFSRTPALVADGNDDIGLVVATSGGMASQSGREITFDAGGAFMMTAAEAGTFISSSAAQFHCFHVHTPRAALALLIVNLDDAVLRPIPPGSEALQYLLSYIGLLRDDRTLASPDLARLAAVHLRDLVALALGATRDAAFVAQDRGLRAARLRAIKRYIIDNLGQHGLTVVAVASRHRVSPRYVQRLFETEGTTFSEFLLDQRLARVYRMLADPRFADRAVSTLALDAGFGDVSYFNRCFRRRFGASPTQFRSMNHGY